MSGVQNNGFWNLARSSPTQLISKTKFCRQILQKSRFGPGKRLCNFLLVVPKVGKFNVDNFWSLDQLISSILSPAILILLNKVMHEVRLSRWIFKYSILIKVMIGMSRGFFCMENMWFSKYFIDLFWKNRPIVQILWRFFWCFINIIEILVGM